MSISSEQQQTPRKDRIVKKFDYQESTQDCLHQDFAAIHHFDEENARRSESNGPTAIHIDFLIV